MKAFLAALVALWMVQGLAFSQQAAALANQKTQIAQAEAEHAQAVKDYPAWLVNAIAAEFAAVLDAGNHYLAAPNQKNLELFRTAKKDQLQRAGVHICKFADASQRIGVAEQERLGDQLAQVMETFTKNEKALEAKVDGVFAQQAQRQEVAQGEMTGDTGARKK
ncbi:MAG: hypothetical protein WCO68_06615 [Verrucomicrobiota bacterium]